MRGLSRSASVAVLLSLVGGLLSLVALGAPAQASTDRDCGDFSTQKAAQLYFLDQGGPQQDPDGLDADHDGVACESNPCPCYTGTSTGGSSSDSTGPKRLRQHARVTRVVDGDTIDVRIVDGPRRRVRLLGIDTPEVYGQVECGGRAASRSLEKLLPRGTRVVLVSDPSQDRIDRYGRILRYVMKAGRDIDRTQVRRGHARVYVYHHNPFERVAGYRKALRQAKAAGRGIWGSC